MGSETKQRIARWWGKWMWHCASVPKEEWDELDAAIRADERARPLPDDLQAVVERVQREATRMAEHSDAEPFFVIRNDSAVKFAADLRTLLAHLTREDR